MRITLTIKCVIKFVKYFHLQRNVSLTVCKTGSISFLAVGHKTINLLELNFGCIVLFLYTYSSIRIQPIHGCQKSGEANCLLIIITSYNKGKQYLTIKITLKIKNMRLLAPKLLHNVYFHFPKQE